MKKFVLLGLTAVLFAGACATGNQNASASPSLQPISVDEALQKVQETREQLQQAKDNYLKAKKAADAANKSSSVSQAVKDQLQEKLDSAKATYEAEKAAWAELLKN